MQNYLRIILRGVSQVFLQNNIWTGLLFLIGIFYNSWILGVGALVGNIVSNGAAQMFKYSNADIEQGLYGFNGTLVGIAVYYFYGLSGASFLLLVLAAALSSVFMRELSKRVPAYTAPFVLATWLVIIIVKFLPELGLGLISYPFSDKLSLASAVAGGVGQVMFQVSVVTGIIFLIGLLVSSRSAAFYGFLGTALGAIFAYFFGFSPVVINAGIYGYSAVLASIALGAEKIKLKNIIFAIFGILLAVLITHAFSSGGLIALTAPFVLATWAILIIKKLIYAKKT